MAFFPWTLLFYTSALSDSGYSSRNSSGCSSSSYADSSCSLNYKSGSSSGFYSDVKEVKSRKGEKFFIIHHHHSNTAKDEPQSTDYSGSYQHQRYLHDRGCRQVGSGSVFRGLRVRAAPGPERYQSQIVVYRDGNIHDVPSTSPQTEEYGDDTDAYGGEDSSESESEATQRSVSMNGRSSSESGSDSSLISPLLDVHRQQTVDRLMAEFRDLLNQSIGIRSRPASTDPSTVPSSAHQGSERNSSQTIRGNRGQNRSGSSPGNNQTGGDGNPAEDSEAVEPSDAHLDRRLACPYFKREPRKHRKHRSCAGPGWTTVHRVKCVPVQRPFI